MRILIAVVVLLAVTVPSADAAVTKVRVPGWTESLALAGPYAFVIRRTREPQIVRVNLDTGRRDVIFRTRSFPSDVVYAANGVVGLGLDVPGDQDGSQVVRIPAAGGRATVVREGRATYEPECGNAVRLNGMTSAGELLVSEAAIACGARKGAITLTAVGLTGDRAIATQPTDTLEDASWSGGEVGPTAYDPAARWRVVGLVHGAVRILDTATGAHRDFHPTLARDVFVDAEVGPDGRVILTERVLRRRGGIVTRIRVAGPAGVRTLGTVGSPPRLQARWCGTRLIVVRTKDRRTRVLEDDRRELARVSTQADPRIGCTADRLLVEGSYRRRTEFHVIAL
jgi:hypothetical protein